MEIDINKKYFLMSFRFNKSKAEEFGLTPFQQDENIFSSIEDNSLWISTELYDFDWGNENGFFRLPKLEFQQLWTLITTSKIQENKYGAAYFIEKEFVDQLKGKLIAIVNQPNSEVDNSMKEAFKILKLDEIKNRSGILNKSFLEINKDFEEWKLISEKVMIMLKS